MKLILAIPAAGLLFSGALSAVKHPSARLNPIASPTIAALEIAPATMWASSDLLYKGESFDLHFSTPHAPLLGVIDPDGKFFYVVFPAENAIGKLQPMVSSERFVALNVLKINTLALKADPYIYGVMENRPVFTKSGVYRFVMGHDLHVDDESTISIVKINYRHQKRPAEARQWVKP
jgi:hypothetical protein